MKRALADGLCRLLADAPPPSPRPDARSPIGVLVRVWDWDDKKLSEFVSLLDALRVIIVEGFYFGLSLDEIENDLVDNCDGVFLDADLTMVEDYEFELTLLPSDAV